MRNLFGWPEHVVYLIQYSVEPIYKIGHTKHLNRRLWQIGTSLPHQITLVHVIRTHDPEWLEDYWHKKFVAQRRFGSGVRRAREWFNLSDTDVADFLFEEEKNREEGDLFRYLESEKQIEEQKTTKEQTLREEAILRLIVYVDELAERHPNCAIKLANSCNFQISELDLRVARMMEKHLSQEQALQRWEQNARSAADAKV